jgi:hypothetical protein
MMDLVALLEQQIPGLLVACALLGLLNDKKRLEVLTELMEFIFRKTTPS